jgi:regulator of replication initiation timing
MSDKERPSVGALDSTIEWRINSTAMKITQAFEAARTEARDEALWLSSICRKLLDDNDRLRLENSDLRKALEDAQQAAVRRQVLP